MELYEFSEDRKKILVYELEAMKEEIVSYKKENILIGNLHHFIKSTTEQKGNFMEKEVITVFTAKCIF